MKRQQGQSLVEFALIAPLLFLMIFGMIWAGFMFMEYLHFSNQVRTVARQIAVTSNDDRTKEGFTEYYQKEVEKIYTEHNMPKMYHPTVKIGSAFEYVKNDAGEVTDQNLNSTFTKDSTEVIVTVAFEMEKDAYESLPNILKNEEDFKYGVGFPPKTIKTIEYRMHLERGGSVTTSNDTTEDTDTPTNDTEGNV